MSKDIIVIRAGPAALSSRTIESVFDQLIATEDYGFDKTVVPVKLIEYCDERLDSRS